MAVAMREASIPIIEARGLGLTFQTGDGPVQALKDVSLTIRRGDFVSFIGPSGCGKTTVLRVIAALAGWVKIASDEVDPRGIRVNNFLPGFNASIDQRPERYAGAALRRMGRVAEAASLVTFLFGDGASYITGQNIRVDCGLARSA